MKNILLFLFNICVYTSYTIINLFVVIITGELPTYSPCEYLDHRIDFIDLFKKRNIIHEHITEEKLATILDKLIHDPNIRDIDVKLYNHKGEEYGTQSLTGYIIDIFEKEN